MSEQSVEIPWSVIIISWFTIIGTLFSVIFLVDYIDGLIYKGRASTFFWIMFGFASILQLVLVSSAALMLKGRMIGRNLYMGIAITCATLTLFSSLFVNIILGITISSLYMIFVFLLSKTDIKEYFENQEQLRKNALEKS